MKIQCDICKTRVAFVFCYTEEMALCNLCDGNHHCGDGGGDHRRFSFFYPDPKPIPICGTCQETKAFIFCLEHREILCRACDASLHGNDDFKKKHTRFLHTNAKLRDSNQSCVSASSDFSSGIDASSDDPYGFCKKDQGSGTRFEDADLRSYLSALSPRNP